MSQCFVSCAPQQIERKSFTIVSIPLITKSTSESHYSPSAVCCMGHKTRKTRAAFNITIREAQQSNQELVCCSCNID